MLQVVLAVGIYETYIELVAPGSQDIVAAILHVLLKITAELCTLGRSWLEH